MKLTLRAKTLGRKITLITTAFVLAVSSLTAAVPFVLSKDASAVSGTSYTNVNPAAGWVVDRTAPSGGWGSEQFAGRQTLYTKVDAPSNASTSFYQYEGIKKAVADQTQTLKADLYIDASWPANVRAGFWGVGYDATGTLSSYPIVEYNTASSATHWRIWDSTGAGGWRDVAVSSAATGWNTIELALNKTDASKTDVYVNGALIGTSAVDETKSLRSIILNNYNFGTDDYTVHWSNIQTGTYNPDAPTNLKFVKDSTSATVPAGSTVSNSDITLSWNTVPNAERYQVRVTDPSGTSQDNRNTGWYTFDLNDATRYGYFGTQQGTWSYQVRTKDATTKLWSDYTAPVTLKFDSVAPNVAVTANGNSLPDSGKVIAGAPTTFVANLTDAHSATYGAYIELFKADYLGGYTGGWVTDNTQAAGSVRYGASPSLVYNLAGLSGKYGLKIVASDQTGNSTTKYVYFTVDNTLPAAAFVSPTPAANAYVRGAVNVAALVSDNNPLAYNLRVEGFGPTAGTSLGLDYKNPFVSGLTYSYSWNTASGAKQVSDGTYRLVAAVRDQADQTGSATRVITIDNTAPQNVTATYTGGLKSVVAPEAIAGKTVGGALTFQVGVEEVNPATMYAEINWLNPATNKWEKHAGWGATITSNNGTLSLDSSAPSGTYQVKVSSIKDKAGNTAPTKTFGFTVDNTSPTVVDVQYSPATLTNGNVIATLTTDGAVTLTAAGWSSVGGSGTVFQKTYTSNVDDDIVDFYDAAGNLGQASITINWIDKVAPVVSSPITSGATVRGTAIFSVNDPTAIVRVNGTPTTSTQLSGNGTYTVIATDLAGNVSNAFVVTINNAQTVNLNPINLQTATPLITGSALWVVDPASVGSVAAAIDGTPYAATIDATGNWSLQVSTPLENGLHTLTVNGATFEFTTSVPASLLTPAITSPAAATTVLGDDTTQGTEGVEGTSTEKNLAAAVDTDSSDGTVLGMAWYWWLLILAALATLIWWIIAALRNRAAQS